MAALVAAIHKLGHARSVWVAGTNPAMTFGRAELKRLHSSIFSSVASSSASRAGLSQRNLLMRGKRMATPDL